MSEWRAVVSSQASGFCGRPSRGQALSAETSASLRASSALATSCVWTERYATRRPTWRALRSEEHTSELQSRSDLVCRLLLEKKKKQTKQYSNMHKQA